MSTSTFATQPLEISPAMIAGESNPSWLDTHTAQWMRKQDVPGAVGPKCGFVATTLNNNDFSYNKCKLHICGYNEDCLAIGRIYNARGELSGTLNSSQNPPCEAGAACSTLDMVDIQVINPYGSTGPDFKFAKPSGYTCPLEVTNIGLTFRLTQSASNDCVYRYADGLGPTRADLKTFEAWGYPSPKRI